MDYKKLKELTQIDDEEKTQIFEQIFSDLTRGKTPNPEGKRLELLTGLPGSGKSFLAKEMMEEDKSLVNVSGDDFYQYHPNMRELYEMQPVKLNNRHGSCFSDNFYLYDFVDEAFLYVTDKLKQDNYGMVIDGLLNEPMLDFVQDCQKEGYQAKVTALVSPKRIIDANIINRYLDREEEMQGVVMNKTLLDRNKKIQHPMAELRKSVEELTEFKTCLDSLEERGTLS